MVLVVPLFRKLNLELPLRLNTLDPNRLILPISCTESEQSWCDACTQESSCFFVLCRVVVSPTFSPLFLYNNFSRFHHSICRLRMAADGGAIKKQKVKQLLRL